MIIGGEKRKEKNLKIKEQIGRAADIILKYQLQEKALTKDLFLKEYSNPSVLTDFYEFMADQVKSRFDITDSTKMNHMAVLNKLKKFKPSLMISELNENFITEYIKNYQKKDHQKTTINRDLKVLRIYINKAIKLELTNLNPSKYIKIKRDKTFPVFLTEAERDKLLKLYNSNFLPDKYQKTLRQFLFTDLVLQF